VFTLKTLLEDPNELFDQIVYAPAGLVKNTTVFLDSRDAIGNVELQRSRLRRP
jgi:hypothetical protein